MTPEQLIRELQGTEEFFERATSALTEEHSTFAPTKEMLTTAQLVAHVALSIDWFIEGAFIRDNGFSMEFEEHDKEMRPFTSLKAAKALLKDSFEAARVKIAAHTDEVLDSLLPDGLVMAGQPRRNIVSGIVDHTAHHRGALTVYTRLQGETPPMPYADM